jgi:membrane-bound serine protease (ClpP class)
MRILLAAIVSLTSLMSAPAAVESIPVNAVVVIPIRGPITEAQFYFIRRVVKQADAAGADAIILDMDTPGGALSATEEITQALLKARTPVYSFVNTNAASAGALIALATQEVFMAPVSAIGAAAPVMGSGQEIGETMNAKVVSYYSGYFRSVAAQHGYNPELVDAFMNLDKEVRVGDRVLNPKGAILTLSAQEAVEEIDGRPLLAGGIVASVGELADKLGYQKDTIVRVEPSGFEQIAQWITMLAPMFLLGGIIGAYLEFKTPGFGVPGLLAGLCFLVFFAGHYVAGLTGFEVVAVFFVGLMLVLVELLFFPGLVVLAGLGTVLMLGALFFAMVDYYPAQPFDFSPEVFVGPLVNLGVAVALAVVAAALLARFLPEVPLFRRFVLTTSQATGPSVSVKLPSLYESMVSVGDCGIARSMLRPAGRAAFGAALVDVVADGGFISPGTPVRVLRTEGPTIVVEEMKSEQAAGLAKVS